MHVLLTEDGRLIASGIIAGPCRPGPDHRGLGVSRYPGATQVQCFGPRFRPALMRDGRCSAVNARRASTCRC